MCRLLLNTTLTYPLYPFSTLVRVPLVEPKVYPHVLHRNSIIADAWDYDPDHRLGCFYECVAPSPVHYEAPFRINLQVSLGRIQSNEEISMPFADFYPFSSFLDAVEIHIREKAAEANGGSRPVVTQGQEQIGRAQV